jgi:hypothetical protein
MARYDFECVACGSQWEHTCSMSARPESLPCLCGGEGRQVILSVPESFVRFRPYEFNKAKNVRSNGRLFGKTDEQHHEGYRRAFDEQKKQVASQRRAGSLFKEGGCEYLGGMPGEMADSIDENEGGKETVAKDPVTWLKKTGMFMGRS